MPKTPTKVQAHQVHATKLKGKRFITSATHNEHSKPQKIYDATRLQTPYLCIIAFLIFIAMLLPTGVFLTVFTVTKSLLFSVPLAIVPGGIGLALAFALKHMATRIYPKSYDEIEVDKIRARKLPVADH